LESWISRRQQDLDVEALLSLLGISRLSGGRFSLEVKRKGDDPMPEETARLRKLIRAVEAIHEGDAPLETNLVLRCSNSIQRTFRVDAADPRIEQLDAVWEGHESMYVVGGRAASWATDLRPLVQQALGIGGNARALRLLDLIPLLDDKENFERKLDQICRELDVPNDVLITNDREQTATSDADAATDLGTDDRLLLRQGDEGTRSGDRGTSPAENVDARERASLDEPEPYTSSARDGQADVGQEHPTDYSPGGGITPRQHRSPGGGSHRFYPPGRAPNRFLIDSSQTEEVEKALRECRLPQDDAAARTIVMGYERRAGRKPEEADRYQRGYDVTSIDSEKRERKIEVKGLQGAWQDDASVAMTGPQFDDALTKEGDWWLYVVENLGTAHPLVIPIRNPAKGTRSFYLYARHWRRQAEPA
jgi:hypothetical protein